MPSKKQVVFSILLIEDDPFLGSLLVESFKRNNFQIEWAESGKVGFEKLKILKPRIILLDVLLPDMNGFEILAKLKARDDLKAIPVIILSNLGQDNEIARGKSLGAVDYLIKAHNTLDEIIDKVKQVVSLYK